MNRSDRRGTKRWRLIAGALGTILALVLLVSAIRAQESIFLPIVSQSPETPTAEATAPPTATATSVAPTNTPTERPTTATPVPPTTTPAPPTATPVPPTATSTPGQGGGSVRFFGNGRNFIDRIVIPIDAPNRPANVGATDFTIEFWLKAEPGVNMGSVMCNSNDGWITGNVIFDRDVYFAGDFGDFGIALNDGRVAFGLSVGASGTTLCGSRTVTDNQWHHIAVTRRTSGEMALFVDGEPDGAVTGVAGDASYNNGRPTEYDWDPYIVLGAEKHDAGDLYPSFNGWLDELRISNTRRYTAAFGRPSAPFTTDGATMALYHFDEGTGATLNDSSAAPGGPSNGQLRVGGAPTGPVWSAESPF
jgi:hypothetical protein